MENAAREALQKQIELEKQDLAEKIQRENQEMRENLKAETKELATKLEGETNTLKENIEKEQQDAKKEQERLEEEMLKGKMTLAEKLRSENAELQERMKQEQAERVKREALLKEEMQKNKEGNKNEILELFDRMKKEVEQQRLDSEQLAKRCNSENEKRIEEAKRIQASRLREKQNLDNYIGSSKETYQDQYYIESDDILQKTFSEYKDILNQYGGGDSINDTNPNAAKGGGRSSYNAKGSSELNNGTHNGQGNVSNATRNSKSQHPGSAVSFVESDVGDEADLSNGIVQVFIFM